MSGIRAFMDGLRAEVTTLPPYNAGLSSEYVRAHYDVQEIAKLGSNENPFGPSPRVLSAIAAAVPDVWLYPDSVSDELRAALSAHLEVPPDRLIFGNGSEDLISVAAHTFLSAGDELVTIAPAFGLHVLYPQSIGVHIRAIPVCRDYKINIEDFIGALTPRTRMVALSNPSNPLGTSITSADMRRLLAAVHEDTLILFDEAYVEYAAAGNSHPPFLQMLAQCQSPWLVLRTFSKAYGLAGIRVGYGIASDASLIQLMDRIRTPFNVNRLAQVAAIAALDDFTHVEQCVSRTIEERERVRSALEELGYFPAPSVANFLFFDAREDASELASRLLPHGVIVKPWREPGFCEHLRVTIGTARANDQFLTALTKAAQRTP